VTGRVMGAPITRELALRHRDVTGGIILADQRN
jgi:hypothetical protein